MIICAACNSELLSGDAFLECAVKTCSKVYHYLCNNRELTLEERATWECPECCCAARKGGRSTELPVRTSAPIGLTNVSSRSRSNPPPMSPENTSTSMALETQLLREQINMLAEQLAGAVASIAQYHTALTNCTQKIELYSEKLIKLEQTSQCQRCQLITSGMCTQLETSCQDEGKSETSKPNPKRCVEQGQIAQETLPIDSYQSKPKPLVNDLMKKSLQFHTAPISEFVPMTSQQNEQTAISTQIGTEQNSANNDWVEVRKQKPKRFSSVRGTAGPEVTSLKAVEFRKYFHLWNMVSGADDILSYLRKLCLGGVCTVEELKSKGDYKSFKIGVPADHFEKCLSADIWPDNARVKGWLFRRQRTSKSQESRS